MRGGERAGGNSHFFFFFFFLIFFFFLFFYFIFYSFFFPFLAPPKSNVRTAKALYQFTAEESNEISFNVGDTIIISRADEVMELKKE